MKKRNVVNIVILTLMLMYAILYKTVLITNYLKYEGIITSLFFILITFTAYELLGFRKTKKNGKRKKTSDFVLYSLVFYFIIYYGSGLLFGFQNSVYSHNIGTIITNITNPLIFIVASEILRNIIIGSNKDKKYAIVGITIVLFLIETLQTILYYDMSSFEGIFKYIACNVLPLSIKHSMLSYLTYYTGIENTLSYRLIMELHVYLLPIFPNLGEYLNCMIDMVFPFIIYLVTSSIVSKHEYVEVDYTSRKMKISDYIAIVLFILVVSLAGGVFGYKLIAIASDSMNPYIARGDAVIVENYKQGDKYKVDDIISFDYNGRNTVHRIVEVEVKDGIRYYHTKGDSNNAQDGLLLPENNVHGKVIVRLKYIGFPAVYVSEIRSKLNE